MDWKRIHITIKIDAWDEMTKEQKRIFLNIVLDSAKKQFNVYHGNLVVLVLKKELWFYLEV